jgi:hypothetical protein
MDLNSLTELLGEKQSMALAGLLFGIGLFLAPACASQMLVLAANSKQRAMNRSNRHVAWCRPEQFSGRPAKTRPSSSTHLPLKTAILPAGW